MKNRWNIKSGKIGQVALEYALSTLTMALIASLLYIIYQPITYNVFAPLDMPDKTSGILKKDHGIGMKEMLYMPLP